MLFNTLSFRETSSHLHLCFPVVFAFWPLRVFCPIKTNTVALVRTIFIVFLQPLHFYWRVINVDLQSSHWRSSLGVAAGEGISGAQPP